MHITLSSREWDIIEHRLTVPEAIAEAIVEGFEPVADEQLPWTYDEVHGRVLDLYSEIKVTREINVSEEDLLAIEIIKDCLEGCTFFADILDAKATGEISPGDFLAIVNAGKSLRKKLHDAGHSVEIGSFAY